MVHYIIGSGGQARTIFDILHSAGTDGIEFVTEEELPGRFDAGGGDVVIIGIGDNFVRQRVARLVRERIPAVVFGRAVHPSAVISRSVTLGPGTVVMPGAVVNTGSQIGAHVILNTNSSVDHDCRIDDFVSIAPRATLGGNVVVGEATAISIGATVSHGCEIGEHTVVGAGAVVVKSLPAYAVCYGVPARMIRSREVGETYL
ncbi:MAG TPA: NeuD/PglB/VioB family sugar acetyltransferase [Longimicrobiales bacterium]